MYLLKTLRKVNEIYPKNDARGKYFGSKRNNHPSNMRASKYKPFWVSGTPQNTSFFIPTLPFCQISIEDESLISILSPHPPLPIPSPLPPSVTTQPSWPNHVVTQQNPSPHRSNALQTEEAPPPPTLFF